MIDSIARGFQHEPFQRKLPHRVLLIVDRYSKVYKSCFIELCVAN